MDLDRRAAALRRRPNVSVDPQFRNNSYDDDHDNIRDGSRRNHHQQPQSNHRPDTQRKKRRPNHQHQPYNNDKNNNTNGKPQPEQPTINPLDDKDLEKTDYVQTLVQLVHNRHGIYDFLLSQNCTPTWKTADRDITHEATVSVKLNAHPIVKALHNNQKDFIFASVQVNADSPSQAVHAMDCCKRYTARKAVEKLEKMAYQLKKNACSKLKNDIHREINSWNNEHEEKSRAYELAIQRVKELIKKADDGLLYGAIIKSYGSWTTGIITDSSDLDISLILPGLFSTSNSSSSNKDQLNHDHNSNEKKLRLEKMEKERIDRENKISHEKKVSVLRAIERQAYNEMKEENGQLLENIIVIKSARVPVLKFYNRECQLNIDITIGSDKSILLSRLLRTYVQEDERLFYLSYIIKQWAKNRMVCGAQYSFINSMGWMIMVIFFLQHITKPSIINRYNYERVLKREDDCEPKTENELENEKLMEEYKDDFSRKYSLVKISNYSSSSHRKRRNYKNNRINNSNNESSIVELLGQFFRFFAHEFDFQREVISVNLQRRTKIFDLFGKHINWALFIEQPLEENENVVSYVDIHNLNETRAELERAAMLCECDGSLQEVWKLKREQDREIEEESERNR